MISEGQSSGSNMTEHDTEDESRGRFGQQAAYIRDDHPIMTRECDRCGGNLKGEETDHPSSIGCEDCGKEFQIP